MTGRKKAAGGEPAALDYTDAEVQPDAELFDVDEGYESNQRWMQAIHEGWWE